MSKGRRLTPREKQGILAACRAGVDYKDVALEFKCAASTVWHMAREAGISDVAANDWFAMPPWERMESFVMGYNEGDREFLR